jgi:hypothetical protein
MFTVVRGSLIGVGLVVTVNMIKDSENNLERYREQLYIEQELEKEKDRMLFQQF